MGHRTGKARTIFRDHTTAIPRHSLLCLLAADLISAWPAPIRQSTPTPPQSGAGHSSPPTQSSPPATLHHRHVTRGQAEARTAVLNPPPERRPFMSKRPDWRFQCDRSPGAAARSDLKRVAFDRRRASGCCFFACRYRKTAAHFCATCINSKKTVASRGQKVLKTVPIALNASRSGCTRQGLMICCRFKENE
jgi:hypothetical protein